MIISSNPSIGKGQLSSSFPHQQSKKQNQSSAGLMLHSPFWWGVYGFSLSQYISATSAECLTHTASAPSIPQQARERDPQAVQPASGKHCSRESQLKKKKKSKDNRTHEALTVTLKREFRVPGPRMGWSGLGHLPRGAVAHPASGILGL